MCSLLACENSHSPNYGNCDDVPEYLSDDITGFTIHSVNAASVTEITNIDEATFRIEIITSNSTAMRSLTAPSSQYKGVRFSLFNTANALSCVAASYRERITMVTVTSDEEFDNAYPAGANLEELFSMNGLTETLSESLIARKLYFGGFRVQLTQMPSEASTHNFTFRFVMDTGAEHSFETGAMQFNPM